MYNEFKKLGIPVSITREDDVTLSPSDRVKKILSYYGNNPNVIVISNHINAGGGEGAEVIYALRDKSALADTVLNEIEDYLVILLKIITLYIEILVKQNLLL